MLIDNINNSVRETQAIDVTNARSVEGEASECEDSLQSKGGRRTRRFLDRLMTLAGAFVALVPQAVSESLKGMPEHHKLALRQAWAQVMGEAVMEAFSQQGLVCKVDVEVMCEEGFEEYSQVGLLVTPGFSIHDASIAQLRQALRMIRCLADMVGEVSRVLEEDSHYSPWFPELAEPSMHERVAKEHSRILERRRREAYNAKRREKRAAERVDKGGIVIHDQAPVEARIPTSLALKTSEDTRLAA